MTKLNTTGVSNDTLFSSKLNYVVSANSKNVSAAHCTVDVDNQSIGLSLSFADNGFGYTVDGMINIRNSNVFIDPK
jgi:hypothetical protein